MQALLQAQCALVRLLVERMTGASDEDVVRKIARLSLRVPAACAVAQRSSLCVSVMRSFGAVTLTCRVGCFLADAVRADRCVVFVGEVFAPAFVPSGGYRRSRNDCCGRARDVLGLCAACSYAYCGQCGVVRMHFPSCRCSGHSVWVD